MENFKSSNIKIKIRKVTTSLIFLIILITLGVSVFYNIELQNQVSKRDEIIERLTKRDSILNQILEIEYDSILNTITYSYRIRDGKVLKYNQISDEMDELQNEYNSIINKHTRLQEENIHNIDDYNSLAIKYNSLFDDYKLIHQSFSTLVANYNINTNSFQNLNKKYNISQDSLSIYKAIVDLTHKVYAIDYNIQIDGNNRKISVTAEKLDSALVLLPYFRDRLKKEKNVWKISLKN